MTMFDQQKGKGQQSSHNLNSDSSGFLFLIQKLFKLQVLYIAVTGLCPQIPQYPYDTVKNEQISKACCLLLYKSKCKKKNLPELLLTAVVYKGLQLFIIR